MNMPIGISNVRVSTVACLSWKEHHDAHTLVMSTRKSQYGRFDLLLRNADLALPGSVHKANRSPQGEEDRTQP